MDYLYDYLLFLAQAVTVVVAVLLILSAIASLGMKRQHHGGAGHLEIRKLNDRLNDLKDHLRQAVLPPGQFKKLHKQDQKSEKQAQKQAEKQLKEKAKHVAKNAVAENAVAESAAAEKNVAESAAAEKIVAESAAAEKNAAEKNAAEKNAAEKNAAPEDGTRSRLFVLHFEGDVQASKVDHLRTEVTAVLTLAEASDEVVVCLESPGGAVHGYGLAASQLDRIRQHGIPLVVAVDKVAASGGYLMAAVADRIMAAPFAVIGSIGVIAQIPNVHRLLKKHDVDVELLTAGKYKRTLTVLGENTDEGREKFVEELEDIHALFQEFVGSRRPALDMEEVATGEVWYGDRALAKKLIDELCTSDEYLARACEDRDVFELRWIEHKKPIERLMAQAEAGLGRMVDRVTSVAHR